MLTREDAQRIASATHCLRPAWSVEQLVGVMGDQRVRVHRQPADIAAALAWLALDAATQQPTRLLAGGPWWGTANATGNSNSSARIRQAAATDCDICGHPADRHVVDSLNDHEYIPRHANGRGVNKPEGLKP